MRDQVRMALSSRRGRATVNKRGILTLFGGDRRRSLTPRIASWGNVTRGPDLELTGTTAVVARDGIHFADDQLMRSLDPQRLE